ncbi:MAG: cation transporting ATPase C-terminal domain-containing protein, partial [Methanoregula sp.]
FFKGNPTFFLVMGGIVFIQVVIIQFGGAVFGTVPLAPVTWLTIAAATFIPVLLIGFVLRLAYHGYQHQKAIPR